MRVIEARWSTCSAPCSVSVARTLSVSTESSCGGAFESMMCESGELSAGRHKGVSNIGDVAV